MQKTSAIVAGIMSGLLVQGVQAEQLNTRGIGGFTISHDPAIVACVDDAMSTANVPNARPYIDSDSGYKKYSESVDHLAGVTLAINPYDDNAHGAPDTVYLTTKFYHEASEEYPPLDIQRTLTIRFNDDGLVNVDHGLLVVDSLVGFGEESPVKQNALDWVDQTTNLMGLSFSICMSLDPYSPADGGHITPAEFPEIG